VSPGHWLLEVVARAAEGSHPAAALAIGARPAPGRQPEPRVGWTVSGPWLGHSSECACCLESGGEPTRSAGRCRLLWGAAGAAGGTGQGLTRMQMPRSVGEDGLPVCCVCAHYITYGCQASCKRPSWHRLSSLLNTLKEHHNPCAHSSTAAARRSPCTRSSQARRCPETRFQRVCRCSLDAVQLPLVLGLHAAPQPTEQLRRRPVHAATPQPRAASPQRCFLPKQIHGATVTGRAEQGVCGSRRPRSKHGSSEGLWT